MVGGLVDAVDQVSMRKRGRGPTGTPWGVPVGRAIFERSRKRHMWPLLLQGQEQASQLQVEGCRASRQVLGLVRVLQQSGGINGSAHYSSYDQG